jgi:hypothetical protein
MEAQPSMPFHNPRRGWTFNPLSGDVIVAEVLAGGASHG